MISFFVVIITGIIYYIFPEFMNAIEFFVLSSATIYLLLMLSIISKYKINNSMQIIMFSIVIFFEAIIYIHQLNVIISRDIKNKKNGLNTNSAMKGMQIQSYILIVKNRTLYLGGSFIIITFSVITIFAGIYSKLLTLGNHKFPMLLSLYYSTLNYFTGNNGLLISLKGNISVLDISSLCENILAFFINTIFITILIENIFLENKK